MSNDAWTKCEKATNSYLNRWADAEKKLNALGKEINSLIQEAGDVFQTAPKTDCNFHDSPMRPRSLETYVKMQLRKAGFKVQLGQGNIADVPLKPLSENVKEAVGWLLKLKPKQ